MRLTLAALVLLAATPALATSESYQPIRVDTTFNFVYGAADVREFERRCRDHAFEVLAAGAQPFRIWDGAAFRARLR